MVTQSTFSAPHSSSEGVKSPFSRLISLLKTERSDLVILLIYTVMAGLLTLAIPIATQALVNTIAAGILIQPLLVLTSLVFFGLLFAGIMRVSQFYLVEILQQRIFARVALQLSQLIPAIQHEALLNEYPPELVNRFFDVVKVQKTLSKLLLDGPAAVLQILVGLTLIAFYSPYLLGFDLLIIMAVVSIAFPLGNNGVKTSILESAEKYRVAGWLQDIARCQVSLKVNGFVNSLVQKTDEIAVRYIKARRSHFKILFRQVTAFFLIQATASAGILGIGGWLVINRQLTLGQLIASELVILIILAALEKLVYHAQEFFDLLTALEKIGHVTDLPLERTTGEPCPASVHGAHVRCQGVYFSYIENFPILNDLYFEILPGERISLVGASGAGKSTLAAILCGLLEPRLGLVEINGADIRDLQLSSLRDQVAMVTAAIEVFEGTIEENITVGRPEITRQDIRWALEVTGLSEDVAKMPDGLQTHLVSVGRNLSTGQIRRLMIARAIVKRPQLLILDEALTGIDMRSKLQILDVLMQPQFPWTLLDISHDASVIARTQRIMVVADGQINELGSLQELSQNPNSTFAYLFPDLATPASRRLS